MSKTKKPFWKKLLIIVVAIIGFFFFLGLGLRIWLSIPNPEISNKSIIDAQVVNNGNYISFNNCKLRHSETGLWEMYVEGADFERGVAIGKMTKDLLKYQEEVFVNQIKQIIPSDIYLNFLRVFIGFFNRKLPDNIPNEYKNEIYGISLSCTDEYNSIGSPFERQLNYHSAHDLGHAMQDYMLVGCTSFASWDSDSEDSTLLIGRNFDFYVGDDFAKNKIVAFYKPDKGYKFSTITWAGMIGVLSGMNEKGLTVAINAAKSSIPTSSAMPISILCREILQYASNIQEAYEIAKKRKTFVSESILIGSAMDNKAVIIEKSPDNIGLYESSKNWLVCANHYQSKTFETDERNIENIKTSDSPYRQKRAEELIQENTPLNPHKAAAILRDQKGKEGKDIGMGNEKALNQLICHHSVVFLPQKKLMYVSTSPWQIGKYVVYNLDNIFSNSDFSKEIKIDSLTIPADSFLNANEYQQFISYKSITKTIKEAANSGSKISDNLINQYIQTNPEYFYVYELAGDYYISIKNKSEAVKMWNLALGKEIPKIDEKERIQKKIDKNKK